MKSPPVSATSRLANMSQSIYCDVCRACRWRIKEPGVCEYGGPYHGYIDSKLNKCDFSKIGNIIKREDLPNMPITELPTGNDTDAAFKALQDRVVRHCIKQPEPVSAAQVAAAFSIDEGEAARLLESVEGRISGYEK